MTNHLDHTIINVVTSYRAIGGRNVTADNIARRFNTLWTAIEALADEYEKTTTHEPAGCGGLICHCSRYPQVHVHEPGECVCHTEYTADVYPPVEEPA